VTDGAADVEHVSNGIEFPAVRHQAQKIEVPPMVARIPEVLG